MIEYQPTSRRPIAQLFRRTATFPVQWCVRLGIHPNLVSYSSVVAALAAGLCFWQAGAMPALLIAAVAFCYVRLWLNMLDGMVALASGKASLIGEIVNELPDRFSDVIIFVAVAHSGLCEVIAGYWAAIAALLTAYVGTMGQAVGVQREFSGLMAKPWRMVALHAGAWTTLGLHWWGNGQIGVGGISNPSYLWAELTVLDWTLIFIVAGCVQTISIRLIRIVRALRAKGLPPAATGRTDLKSVPPQRTEK
jgi:phosphatidylglycerophosphate synthase